MWRRLIPWRTLLRKMAQAQGFVDPVKLLGRIQRFSQPSEVLAPVELLRLSAVLHARGLMNSQAIQHNLDWVWPYWVNRQFDPLDKAFVPRAFSLTHINLTHRNWTAVGLPDSSNYPIVDPAGLVTPFYDSWSIDAWWIGKSSVLLPSRLKEPEQEYLLDGNLAVETRTQEKGIELRVRTEMFREGGHDICQVRIAGKAEGGGKVAVSLRPYNPEGISQVHHIERLRKHPGWRVNGHEHVFLSREPEAYFLSRYGEGDVFGKIRSDSPDDRREIRCEVELATAAALFDPGEDIVINIPLTKKEEHPGNFLVPVEAAEQWRQASEKAASFKVPDPHFQFLYNAAVKTLLLHTAQDVYPGPYTYKHFWFRDAAIILNALICGGMTERAERILDTFPERQRPSGFFRSQEGEWDSNGQVLWVFDQYRRLTGKKLPEKWQRSIYRGADWLERKRLRGNSGKPHAGLLPAGFSAEHLGPNDYYFWDDFWGIAGQRAAAAIAESWDDKAHADRYRQESESFVKAVEASLETVSGRLGHHAMPASPYRRMDTGAIGSMCADYPLQIWEPGDVRTRQTADYLYRECRVPGGFFHDMSHSGINPYLTLHIAQSFLRSKDARYFELISELSDTASPTGQWPEAVHPGTRGGCMGDGQHVWAAAEWLIMMRYLFVREEGEKLILFSGIPEAWLKEGETLVWGPAPTEFGRIGMRAECRKEDIVFSWQPAWHGPEPAVEIDLPFHETIKADHGSNHFVLSRKGVARK